MRLALTHHFRGNFTLENPSLLALHFVTLYLLEIDGLLTHDSQPGRILSRTYRSGSFTFSVVGSILVRGATAKCLRRPGGPIARASRYFTRFVIKVVRKILAAGLVRDAIGTRRTVRPGRCCSPRHRMPRDSRNEGLKCVSMTCRAVGLAAVARKHVNVIGCHLTSKTRVQKSRCVGCYCRATSAGEAPMRQG